MKRRDFLGSGVSVMVAPIVLTSRKASAQTKPVASGVDDGWVTLFNGRNLDGWYTFLPSTGKNNDPKKVFKVEQKMLHVLDIPVTGENQEYGYLGSNQEYSNCRIKVEFKWGIKRFPPRLEAKRDNGLLYFIVGEDKVWPTCVECQIQETDTGDIWILGGTVVTSGRGGGGGGGASGPGPQSSGRIVKDGDFEDRNGWNVIEVILQEDRVTHLVNGRIVNAGRDIKQPDPQNPGQLIPLKSGRIALQAEGAECWYRSVKMRPLVNRF